MAPVALKSRRKRKRRRNWEASPEPKIRSGGKGMVRPEKLQTSIALLDTLASNFGQGLITFDRRGLVTSWNRGAKEIYGYKEREVIGKTPRMILPKGGLQEWREGMKRVLKHGEVVWNKSVERIRKDGERIKVTSTSSPLRSADGVIVGAASIVNEISEDKLSWERVEGSDRGRFTASKDINFICGRDGKLLEINEGGVKAFGYHDKKEMMQLDIPEDLYVDPHDRTRLEEKIARNGYAVDYEVRLRKKNGEIVNLYETSIPIRDEHGDIVAYEGLLRRRREKKVEERRAKETEENYRSLIEHSPDGIAVIREGKFLYVNRVLMSLYGYDSKEELLKKSITKIVSDEETEEVLNWFLRRESDLRTSAQLEFRGLRQDGKKIEVEVRVTRVPFQGKTCLLSFHREISERKHLHRGLSEAERIVGDILATMGDALVITDLHGKVLQVNLEFETMTGFSRKEAVGVEFPYPWLLEEEMSRFVLWIAELRTKNYLHDFDMYWLTKDKRKLAVSLNTTLLRNNRGEPIAMLNIARDISERKRLAEELEARTKQIETLYQETLSKSLEIERRNKELDDFAYVVSHDLKEPLVTIEGYGKILYKDFEEKLGSTGLEYLNSVITAANRMKKFIDDLLALTRLTRVTESFRPTSIGALLDEIQRDFEFTLRERNVQLIIENTMPVIQCNESQMKLLFQNLLSNALKFNDKSSPKVVIGYHEEPKDDRFFVRDNGIGIEEEYFEKIFGIFQRLHRSEEYSGTGVGLTIAKKIIDVHKGKIWIESKIGKGTTVHFSIPKSKS